jgi:hypothetical protein
VNKQENKNLRDFNLSSIKKPDKKENNKYESFLFSGDKNIFDSDEKKKKKELHSNKVDNLSNKSQKNTNKKNLEEKNNEINKKRKLKNIESIQEISEEENENISQIINQKKSSETSKKEIK